MKEKEEDKSGQCNKDSDCGTGYVCVNGKCVPDIGAVEKLENEADS